MAFQSFRMRYIGNEEQVIKALNPGKKKSGLLEDENIEQFQRDIQNPRNSVPGISYVTKDGYKILISYDKKIGKTRMLDIEVMELLPGLNSIEKFYEIFIDLEKSLKRYNPFTSYPST